MSDHSENNPRHEFLLALAFLALFAALAGWIFYGGYTRPAAPKSYAETMAIIAPDSQKPTVKNVAPAVTEQVPVVAESASAAPEHMPTAEAKVATQ